MNNKDTEAPERESPDRVWITWDDAYPWETPEMGGEEYVRAASLIDTRAPVDSQAEFDGPCTACGHNNYDAERRECKQRWMEGRMSVVCGCPCAKHNSLANAATQMRTACVQAIRGLRHKSEPDESRWNAALYHAETTLESLTLDQVKQKEQSK